jgi:hypothetical protein
VCVEACTTIAAWEDTPGVRLRRSGRFLLPLHPPVQVHEQPQSRDDQTQRQHRTLHGEGQKQRCSSGRSVFRRTPPAKARVRTILPNQNSTNVLFCQVLLKRTPQPSVSRKSRTSEKVRCPAVHRIASSRSARHPLLYRGPEQVQGGDRPPPSLERTALAGPLRALFVRQNLAHRQSRRAPRRHKTRQRAQNDRHAEPKQGTGHRKAVAQGCLQERPAHSFAE